MVKVSLCEPNWKYGERNSFEKSEEFVRLAPTFTFVSFVILYERSENERKNKQTLHGNWCVFCNNVLKFYTHTMDSLGENEFCETNVKEGAKRTNDSLSFLFGNESKLCFRIFVWKFSAKTH